MINYFLGCFSCEETFIESSSAIAGWTQLEFYWLFHISHLQSRSNHKPYKFWIVHAMCIDPEKELEEIQPFAAQIHRPVLTVSR